MALLGVLARFDRALGIYLTPPSVTGSGASDKLLLSDEDRHPSHEQFAKDMVEKCASLIVKATQLPEDALSSSVTLCSSALMRSDLVPASLAR